MSCVCCLFWSKLTFVGDAVRSQQSRSSGNRYSRTLKLQDDDDGVLKFQDDVDGVLKGPHTSVLSPRHM